MGRAHMQPCVNSRLCRADGMMGWDEGPGIAEIGVALKGPTEPEPVR